MCVGVLHFPLAKVF
jgi:hypothetical protein